VRTWRWSLGLALILSVTTAACGASGGSVDRAQARVQRAVDDFLSRHTILGASVAVMKGDQLTVVSSGVADLQSRRAVSRHDEFRLASITKNYVAALAITLVDEGALRLDDTVGKWLPHLNERLSYMHDVTLRQLLSHTSGIAQTATADRDRGKGLSVEDVLARFPAPVCTPATCWNYADGNYVIAGLMLEAAAGQSLDALVQSRLLAPLRLTETHFVANSARRPVQPYVLVVDPNTYQPRVPHELRPQLLPIVPPIGATGMMASAGDLARWASALFRDHVLTGDGLTRMLDTSAMNKLRRADGFPHEYGLGVAHYEIAGRRLVGHDGSSGSIVVHDREKGVTVSILTNGGEQDMAAFLEKVLAAAG
jgi:D-alanyl-D-alanine carboxypeptidase